MPMAYNYFVIPIFGESMNQQDVLAAVLEAVTEFNEQLDGKHKLELSSETRLLGKDSKLDSFGLVNLIIVVEEKLYDKFDKSITLADERAMSQEHSPFRSVQSLADYAHTLLSEN
jgi:acyl carrier protein